MNNQPKIDLRKTEQRLFSERKNEWYVLTKARAGNDFGDSPLPAYTLRQESGKWAGYFDRERMSNKEIKQEILRRLNYSFLE